MTICLSQLKWPNLAQDLAIMSVPGSPIDNLDIIYSTYGISAQELKDIVKIPKFRELFTNCLAEFQAQGSKAANIYRATALSQALSEKLYSDAMDDKLEAKDSLKLLELLFKASGQLDRQETQVNTQVNVGVNLPLPSGLSNKKLDHMKRA